MKVISLAILLLITAWTTLLAQVPVPSSGKIQRFENFPSKYVMGRNVDVWLPENYNSKNKYAVLYMHDGQMLFDSTTTWNKQEWQVDEKITTLLNKNEILNVIVVGIWNTGETRHSEYFPEKPLAFLPTDMRESLIKNELKGKAQADEYLMFLTKELKPFIDKKFSTLKSNNYTFIAGSSMGGLISMYAICEYPQIFGGAACLSTHWPGSIRFLDNAIPSSFNTYLERNLPSPKNHKIYFDYGTATLDSLYKPHQEMIDITMKKRYDTTKWVTLEFIGEDHSEKAWSKRLDIPLKFLLNKEEKK